MCRICKYEHDYSEFERERAEYEQEVLRAAKEIKDRQRAEKEQEAKRLKFITSSGVTINTIDQSIRCVGTVLRDTAFDG